jgi:hypothetical protein
LDSERGPRERPPLCLGCLPSWRRAGQPGNIILTSQRVHFHQGVCQRVDAGLRYVVPVVEDATLADVPRQDLLDREENDVQQFMADVVPRSLGASYYALWPVAVLLRESAGVAGIGGPLIHRHDVPNLAPQRRTGHRHTSGSKHAVRRLDSWQALLFGNRGNRPLSRNQP